jgi:hypothetical protein
MTAPRPRTRQQPKQLDAGIFQAEISSFALRLAAEGKAAKTIRTYTEAVQWFAAARLPRRASRANREQVDSQDIQQWMTWLLDHYSSAYASNQYRALQRSSHGWPPKTSCPTRWPGCSRRASPTSWPRSSPARSWPGWNRPVRAAAPRHRDHRGVQGILGRAGWPPLRPR